MIVAVVWFAFCPIAGVMAYLITYEEYRRHFPDAARARREALLAGLMALGLFAVIGVAAALLLPRLAR